MPIRALALAAALAALTGCGELGLRIEPPEFPVVAPGAGVEGGVGIVNQDDSVAMVVGYGTLPAPFEWAAEAKQIMVSLSPRSTRVLPVRFRPEVAGTFEVEAALTLRTETRTVELRFPLRGIASPDGLCGGAPCGSQQCDVMVWGACSWSLDKGNVCDKPPLLSCRIPTWSTSIVDFGQVQPGATEVVRQVAFVNPLSSEVVLSPMNIAGSGEFRVIAPGGDPQRLVLPPKSSVVLDLGFKAAEPPGVRLADLVFSIQVPDHPVAAIRLVARVGGPDIDVAPASIDFGVVEHFAPFPVSVTRRVTVRNLGLPVPPESNGHLRIGRFDDAGKLLKDSQFVVTSTDPLTPASAFSVRFAEAYFDSVGISPEPGNNSVELSISYLPTANFGIRTAEVQIHSNDPDEPVVRVPIRAEVVKAPECVYSVSPGALDFGSVSSGWYRDLAVTIQNLAPAGGANCTLLQAYLAPSKFPFTVPFVDTPVVIPGGQSLEVVVRAVQVFGPTTGTLSLALSSGQAPWTTVLLSVKP